MEIPRHWRLKVQRYRLAGATCPVCVRLISQAELNEYTRTLAIAVTENVHHFIGHGLRPPGSRAN